MTTSALLNFDRVIDMHKECKRGLLYRGFSIEDIIVPERVWLLKTKVRADTMFRFYMCFMLSSSDFFSILYNDDSYPIRCRLVDSAKLQNLDILLTVHLMALLELFQSLGLLLWFFLFKFTFIIGTSFLILLVFANKIVHV